MENLDLLSLVEQAPLTVFAIIAVYFSRWFLTVHYPNAQEDSKQRIEAYLELASSVRELKSDFEKDNTFNKRQHSDIIAALQKVESKLTTLRRE